MEIADSYETFVTMYCDVIAVHIPFSYRSEKHKFHINELCGQNTEVF
jgi:hypothetical protein